jgi:hypothetical protein
MKYYSDDHINVQSIYEYVIMYTEVKTKEIFLVPKKKRNK